MIAQWTYLDSPRWQRVTAKGETYIAAVRKCEVRDLGAADPKAPLPGVWYWVGDYVEEVERDGEKSYYAGCYDGFVIPADKIVLEEIPDDVKEKIEY